MDCSVPGWSVSWEASGMVLCVFIFLAWYVLRLLIEELNAGFRSGATGSLLENVC